MMIERMKPISESGKPGRTEIGMWFSEMKEAEDPRTKRYYRNLIARKVSRVAQDPIKKYRWAPNKDDLLGAAYEGLAAAMNTFDPKKCDNFYFWADLYIKLKVGREKYSEKKWLDRSEVPDMDSEISEIQDDNDVVWLDETVPDGKLSPEEEMQKKEIWEQVFNTLDSSSQEILVNYLDLGEGEQISERAMAEKMGVSRGKVASLQRDVLEHVKMWQRYYAEM